MVELKRKNGEQHIEIAGDDFELFDDFKEIGETLWKT